MVHSTTQNSCDNIPCYLSDNFRLTVITAQLLSTGEDVTS